ncbi:ferredoxin reductase family protein [Candidatus Protofrankia datiscae]|uniref:Ferric reductase domain protein protein transmembrane component domain protein n=1 Tax=Candidatus Protofrankia datiscae TaxID=2716812 RepID=F8AWZ7_9ACTN|nr:MULTISPECIES: ferredoxin reductase family protein [Protofrankia]AEH11443.1 Ferric reductase domain protein protein transmembrane component domain protein [Candidatus Protofrankia datiscae]
MSGAARGRPVPPRWSPGLAVRLALAAWGVVVVALWWFDTSASSVHGAGPAMTAAGRVSGLLAAYLVLVQLLLMARIPVLERAVGFDRLAAWHRGLGANVVLLIVVHILLTVWGYGLTTHHQPLSELVTVVTTYPEMWKATVGTLLFVAVGVVSARAVRRCVSYEAWYLLHLTAYLAVLLVYSHQTATGVDFVGHPVNRLLWQGMYLAVAACLVIWRLVLPAVAVARHRMTVERVVHEAPGVVSVWIRGRDLHRLGAVAGQFLLWRFAARGHLVSAHPYSLSAPPRPDRLRITVRATGDHSRAIAHLRPGTPVVAEGPFGHFTAEHATRGRTLLVGGGSGIGPVRALAEDLLARGDDVVVVHRVSRADDLILWLEFERLAGNGRLIVHRVVGSRRDLGHDPLAARFLVAAVPDVAERDVFVCGPPGMTRAVVQALRGLGLSDKQIHTEEFTLR